MSGLPPGSRTELFTSVLPFYSRLLADLERAQRRISMIYHAFVHGEWSRRIAAVLIARAQAGVNVRLMTDGFGIFLEKRAYYLRNLQLIRRLQAGGVKVDIFHPDNLRIMAINRLHIKLSAIDDQIAFVGGSNIADHYLTWDDTNLRLQGPAMSGFHDVYDEVLGLSSRKPFRGNTWEGSSPQQPMIRLTIPQRKKEIREALLGLIEDADQAIHLRTWYFLPDNQVLHSLVHKARSGVDVCILLSHRTRVRPIDFMNRPMCRRIAKAGGSIYRYTERYMHAKVAWNDKGDVLLGSANMDYTGMNSNFECSLALRDPCLRDQLQEKFMEDAGGCLQPHAQMH